MKRLLLVFAILITCLLMGCAKTSPTTTKEKRSSNTMYKNIDIDLSIMSSTVVYSQVYDMVTNPDKYIDNIIKVKGVFNVYKNQSTNVYYPSVIIKDATACCAQGLEFLLYGRAVYPTDYPRVNQEITIIGKFSTYYEGKQKFCRLKDTVLV
ncbi:MAG: hypothetical protein K6F59_03525 [Gammaproteobacteria bacterium]|nr:hypothetical protein [Gammaproteobacteria bacterium]